MFTLSCYTIQGLIIPSFKDTTRLIEATKAYILTTAKGNHPWRFIRLKAL